MEAGVIIPHEKSFMTSVSSWLSDRGERVEFFSLKQLHPRDCCCCWADVWVLLRVSEVSADPAGSVPCSVRSQEGLLQCDCRRFGLLKGRRCRLETSGDRE